MLHKNTVESGTLGTLMRLMKLSELKQFALVGGTNLALRLGHRFSVEEIEGIRMLSIPDIIPMKLGAMARRGSKKDFWDIAYLLDHYSLSEMLDFFKKKYQNDDIGYVVMSLTYFNDTENQDDPIVFQKMTWEKVKNKVREAVLDYMKKENF